MEDLVGVGVADAAEEMRIGQGALERVVLATEDGIELLESRREQLEPARVLRLQGVFAPDQEEGRPCFVPASVSSRLPVREIEGRQVRSCRELDAGRLPVEPSGDHQVQHQP